MSEQGPGPQPLPADKDGTLQFSDGKREYRDPAAMMGAIVPRSEPRVERVPAEEASAVEVPPAAESVQLGRPIISPDGVQQFPHAADQETRLDSPAT